MPAGLHRPISRLFRSAFARLHADETPGYDPTPPKLFEQLETRILFSTFTVGDDAGDDFSSINQAVQFTGLNPGDEILVDGGTYRERVNLTQSGTAAERITLRAADGEDVFIKGSDRVTGWTAVDASQGIYQRTGWTHFAGNWSSSLLDDNPNNNGTDARNRARNQLFVEGSYYQEVPDRGSESALQRGQFKILRNAGGSGVHTVQLRLQAGQGTAGLDNVEMTTRENAIYGNGASFWNIEGFKLRHGDGGPQEEALLRLREGGDITLRSIDVRQAAGAGISLRLMNNVLVEDSAFIDNGQLGLHASSADNTTVRRSELSENNRLAGKTYSTGWEAGGTKVSRSDNFVFDDVEVANNSGSGIWFDIDNHGGVVSNSRLHGNLHGVHYEISYGGRIFNNLIYDAQTQGQGGNVGIGVFISASGENEVYNNTIHDNAGGGIFVGEPEAGARGDGSGRFVGSWDNRIVRNIISENASGNKIQLFADRTLSNAPVPNSSLLAIDALRLDNPSWTFDDKLRAGLDPATEQDRLNFADENLFYVGSGSARLTPSGSLDDFRQSTFNGTGTPTNWSQGSFVANPLFVDAANLDFRLQADSPALAAGIGARPGGTPDIDDPDPDPDPVPDTDNVVDASRGSLSVLFRTQPSDGAQMLVFGAEGNTGSNGFGSQAELHLHVESDGRLGFFMESGTSAQPDVRLISTQLVDNGQWYQATATWDADGTVRLYLDGTEVASQAHNGAAFGTSALLVGRPVSDTRLLLGEAEQVKAFDRQLSQTEVEDLAIAAGTRDPAPNAEGEVSARRGSVSVLFRTQPSDGAQMLVFGAEGDTGRDGFGTQAELHLHIEPDGRLGFFIESGTSAQPDVRIASTTAVDDGQWYLATATWDADGVARLYLNGAEVDSQAHNGATFDVSDLLVGRPVFDTRLLVGEAEQLKAFDRQLSQTEVEDLATAAGVLNPVTDTEPQTQADLIGQSIRLTAQANAKTLGLNGARPADRQRRRRHDRHRRRRRRGRRAPHQRQLRGRRGRRQGRLGRRPHVDPRLGALQADQDRRGHLDDSRVGERSPRHRRERRRLAADRQPDRRRQLGALRADARLTLA